MKINIKNIGLAALGIVMSVSFTACTGDLDVEPIDPNLSTPNNVLTTSEAYEQLLAKAYSGLSVSGYEGDNSDINGIDAGFGQYLRAYFNLTELPTDECVMSWNDQTIRDLHGLCWSTSDVFVTAMFYRVTQQIQVCNEIIRQLNAASSSVLDDATKTQYIAEAKALCDLSYLHGIDLFGGMPFQTEENSMTALPSYISRSDLYTWLENDLKTIVEELPANPEKYRAGKGFAYMMLAKLHLNAEVYAGKNAYADCVQDCQNIINLGYQLESANNWHNLFQAENDQYIGCNENGMGHEIIFSVYQDHTYTQAYGGTCYIINAACGTDNTWSSANEMGLGGSGWAGITVTPEFVDKFPTGDQRAIWHTDGMSKEVTSVMTQFVTCGYAYKKFTNLKNDGTMIDGANSFPDTDFPVYRLADVYLMLAECEARGASVSVNGHNGAWFFNQVHQRAGDNAIISPSLSDILDERARELAWECHRRSDLVRFNSFTDGDIWSFKGMNNDNGSAHNVDSHFNLFPIPATEISNNSNLQQNPGY